MLVQKSETIREHIKYIVIYYTVSGFELPINAYPLISDDDNLKGPLIEKIEHMNANVKRKKNIKDPYNIFHVENNLLKNTPFYDHFSKIQPELFISYSKNHQVTLSKIIQ